MKRGRPKSTLLKHEVLPLIVTAIDEAEAAGELVSRFLASRVAPLLRATRLDDYPHVARLTLRAIGVRRERFDAILTALRLPPLERYPRRRAKHRIRRPRRPVQSDRPAYASCGSVTALLADSGSCVNRTRCHRRRHGGRQP